VVDVTFVRLPGLLEPRRSGGLRTRALPDHPRLGRLPCLTGLTHRRLIFDEHRPELLRIHHRSPFTETTNGEPVDQYEPATAGSRRGGGNTTGLAGRTGGAGVCGLTLGRRANASSNRATRIRRLMSSDWRSVRTFAASISANRASTTSVSRYS